MSDPSQKAIEFVQAVGAAVLQVKPEANQYEIIGTVYLILNKTIETFKNEDQRSGFNAQQQETVSAGTSEVGAGTESKQVQRTGSQGRISEGTKGILDQQEGTTKSGAKKRRSSK